MFTRISTLVVLLFTIYSAHSQCFLTPSEACLGDCGPVFYLIDDPEGTTYEWSISCGTITNPNAANPHTVCFTSAGTCTVQVIVTIPGEDPDTCVAQVNVLPSSLHIITEGICENDSIEINGMYYTPGFYTDTIFGGAANTCDSILLITVFTAPLDTTAETYLGCEGDGYSISVNGVVYDEANPSGSETLLGSDGCDSIVNIDLVFQPNILDTISYEGCEGDGFSVVVDMTTYDESNPAGTETFVATNGCDSIVTINLIFHPIDYQAVLYQGCSGDGYSYTVMDSVFNEDNPTGIFMFSTSTCDSIVFIDLHFDTLISSLVLDSNQLCAFPEGLTYRWMNCDSTLRTDTTSCITLVGAGCACVIIEKGGCVDTLCQDYNLCNLTCEIIAIAGICLGDSVLYTATGNYSADAVLDWNIMLDPNTTFTFSDTDSVKVAYNATGCFSIDLSVSEAGCVSTCTDTICVVDRPIVDFCCDQVRCDSCVTINLWLSGTSPWTIAISDGTNIDTISGITTSLYDYTVCPPYDSIVYYHLLWVVDSSALCEGSIINDSVLIYLEERPEASISISGDTLYAFPDGYAYAWSDCQNTASLGINGYYAPTTNSCYCVIVSTFLSDCRDTVCVEFVSTGIRDPLHDAFTTYYDPAEQALYIKGITDTDDGFSFDIIDLQGRKIEYLDVEKVSSEAWKVQLQSDIPSIVWISIRSKQYVVTKAVFIPTY